MREILFRGKREDNGEWVEGVPFFEDKRGYMIHDLFICDEYNCTGADNTEILPATVRHYTGLTDKNGKKIFEGDVVAGALHWLEQNKNGVVTFRDGSFGLLWYRGEAEQFNPFTSMCNITYEVIGNIHDNPELLKGGAVRKW